MITNRSSQRSSQRSFQRFSRVLHLLLLFSSILPDCALGSRYATRLQYENSCGDLAIACVAHCPPFQAKCYASQVAESVRDAVVTDSPPPIFSTQFPININTGPPASPSCRGNKKNYCVIPRDYERFDDCCPGMRCIPFRHVNGKSAVIGYCHRHYNKK